MRALRTARLLLIATVLSFAPPGHADDEKTRRLASGKEFSATDVALFALVIEGVIAANAYMAAAEPEAYGALLILLSPVAMGGGHSSDTSDVTRYAGLAGGVGLGVYNLTEIDEDSMSRNEIVKKNIIGWHVFILSVGVTAWLAGDFTPAQTSSFSVRSHKGEPMLTWSFNF